MQNTVLRGRYKIVQDLGRGGFGETYLAEDLDRPRQPKCVVKKLRATFNSVKELEIAKRFFNTEAQVLYSLGDRHAQIPRLLAHFEEDSNFYLVQDFVDGKDLSQEFASGKKWNESQVVAFLKDILETLAFVHQQKVIHRDIKPANIIRRKQDGKLVLIDFGAVKEIQTIVNTQGNTHLTVGIGTQGYMPLEQRAGKPRYNSDIYAVGMTAIQALTGISPEKLPEDEQTDEVIWRGQAKVSDRLATILDKMVKPHYRDRYQAANEVLQDLDNLTTRGAQIVTSQSKSRQAGDSTVISNATKQQVLTRQQPVTSNSVPDEPRPKHSFGFAIALSAMAAVAATLGVSQLVSYLQSKPTIQSVAQTPPSSSPVPTVTPIESPSPLAVTPESSPSTIASATPEATPVAISTPATPQASPVFSNSQSAIPLTRMKCLKTTSGNSLLGESSTDITIGQEIATAVAYLGESEYRNYIPNNTYVGVACLIASPDSSTQFRRLKLTFSVNSSNRYSDNFALSLTVYANRQRIGSKQVKRGEKQVWEIDVTNVRNIGLEAVCDSRENCPVVAFTQAELD